MTEIITPQDLLLGETILIVPLSKGWSDEARAAAIAARQAKSAGKDPREAKMRARELVRGGASPTDAASKAVADSGNVGSPNTLAVDIADVSRPDSSFASGSAEERDYAASEASRLADSDTSAGSQADWEAQEGDEQFAEDRGLGMEPGSRSFSLMEDSNYESKDVPEGTRLKTVKAKDVQLKPGERPLDYGHVNDLLKEKYGPTRGEKMYQRMIDDPRSERGLYFVIGEKIQKEKRAMLNELGLGRDKDLGGFNYQQLHNAWLKGQGKSVNNDVELVLSMGVDPVLVVPLAKGWSDEARAAAIAARQAKSQGKDPKAAAEAAKALVREGATPKEAAAQAVKGGGSARGSSIPGFGEGDPVGAVQFVNDHLKSSFGDNEDVEWDTNNVHDSELISIYSKSGDPEIMKQIEAKALDIEERGEHPGLTAVGWSGEGKEKYYVIDVNSLEFP